VTELALTFDDGPDPRWTPRLLDALEAAGARATFFVIAGRAAACPDIIHRATRAGHVVGLHCNEHARHSSRTAGWIADDTAGALAQLRCLGIRPTLWRTPWGVVTPATRRLADEHGLRLVGWDVDTHDWRGDGASAMFASTRDQLRPGAVVLAHDGIGPGARRTGAAETVRYVRLVTEYAAAHGLQPIALA
jgi:peptidoglycan-N-acetylglucosamine deacetylase